ncbi:MAG: UDP-N-acetylmuramate dehydrogenase [Duodenibacillus sp.]|nr:UDP-N-acetylmuramate dehydrogenase [Duodenibacillus sp.]
MMPVKVIENADLAPLNTLRLPARARFYAEPASEEELRELLADPRYATLGRFVLGGGSNIVFTRDFDGLVIRPVMAGSRIVSEDADDVVVYAEAGLAWNTFVEGAVASGFSGVENLAGVPGTVGGAVVQNIGAYGMEAAESVASVRILDPLDGSVSEIDVCDCDYGYRTSRFKGDCGKEAVVLGATFRLKKAFAPVVGYKELEAVFAGSPPAGPRAVADAVRAIRARKLPDPAAIGNAGSFFKNPVVSRLKARSLLEEDPRLVHYSLAGGRVKLAAGWLIDSVGLKGKRIGDAGVYERQALVLVNHGAATGADIMALAAHVQDIIWRHYGVRLEPEPVIL